VAFANILGHLISIVLITSPISVITEMFKVISQIKFLLIFGCLLSLFLLSVFKSNNVHAELINYTNPEQKFSIEYDNTDWQIREGDKKFKEGDVYLINKVTPEAAAIMIDYNLDSGDQKHFKRNYKVMDNIVCDAKNYMIFEQNSSKYTIDGNKAFYTLCGDFASDKNDAQMMVGANTKHGGFGFTFGTTRTNFNSLLPEVEAILDSIKILK